MRASDEANRSQFLEWAKAAAIRLPAVHRQSELGELAPLASIVEDVPFVALTEGTHGAAEPLEFRNKAFQYLVKNAGFTAIAIESGIVESRILHDYVRGARDGDLTTLVSQGIGWTMDQLPQNVELVRWMREYNDQVGTGTKLNFYGFDIPGSPGNNQANRGMNVALAEVLIYLAKVDETAGRQARGRIEEFLPYIRFDFCRNSKDLGYDQLTATQRDTLTSAIADLVALFARSEARYSDLTGHESYEWAHRASIGARQVDTWLRCVPLNWRPGSPPFEFPSEQTQFLSDATDARDRIQAENFEWITKREGAKGKVLIFAHRYHLSAAPLKTNLFWPDKNGLSRQEPAGTYLRRSVGDRLITVGHLIGHGDVACADFKQKLDRAPSASVDGLLSELNEPSFLLDLRSAPRSIKGWLNAEHQVGHGRDLLRLELARAYDVLFFTDAVSPATSVNG